MLSASSQLPQINSWTNIGMNNDKFFDLVKDHTIDLYAGDLSTAKALAQFEPCKVTFFSNHDIDPHEATRFSIKNFTMASSAAMTSAYICMLDREAIKTLAVRYPSDAQYVLARIRLSLSWLLGFPGLMRRLVLGRIKIGGLFLLREAGRSYSLWLIIKRTKKTTPASRLILPKSVGVEAFLAWLKAENINYVVPRFYEELPKLHRDGGDLDLLVADEHVEKVTSKIRSFSNKITDQFADSIPIGMHAISSAAGIPYYPPQLATGVLERSIDGPAASRIPVPLDDFHMFIYHALYHSKSYSSGIPSIYKGKMENPPENDYAGLIQKKAKDLGIRIGHTMEDLDCYMAKVGWQPKRDTLAKISERNAWVRDHFFGNAPPSLTGLTVFILKESAVSNGLTNKVVDVMKGSGVKIVDVIRLSTSQKDRAIREIRGGNWTGPDRSTHGLFPESLIVGVDPNCVGLKSKHAYEYDRSWSKIHKGKVREAFDVHGNASIVHAADNTFESLEYLDACLDEKDKDKMLEKIDRTLSCVRYANIRRLFSFYYLSHLIKFNLRDFAMRVLS